MRLAFAGTPTAAVPSLRALLDSSRHQVVAVITRPAARAGRGRHRRQSPVEVLALEAGLPVLTPDRPSDPDFLAELTRLEVQCCPVVAYGALLLPAVLEVPEHGWVNLHFSLLPAWRGAAPVQHAILRGDDITGATTFQIERGLDTGPVFGLVTEVIRPHDTAGDLLERLSISGATLLAATMDGIAAGSLRPHPQPSEGVSIASKITVTDARLDWTLPANHVDRLVRACTPAPGAWTTFRGERLKLGPVRMTDGVGEPGAITISRNAVRAGTATTQVELDQVHPPGRRAMAAGDWARGVRAESGEHFV
ncbi:MAG: methionyl-tRNA formyltransferase [Actinomycetota bacterium]|nr:methionyl-tRNA formyltransferase [Actinomycetota bacterium]